MPRYWRFPGYRRLRYDEIVHATDIVVHPNGHRFQTSYRAANKHLAGATWAGRTPGPDDIRYYRRTRRSK